MNWLFQRDNFELLFIIFVFVAVIVLAITIAGFKPTSEEICAEQGVERGDIVEHTLGYTGVVMNCRSNGVYVDIATENVLWSWDFVQIEQTDGRNNNY